MQKQPNEYPKSYIKLNKDLKSFKKCFERKKLHFWKNKNFLTGVRYKTYKIVFCKSTEHWLKLYDIFYYNGYYFQDNIQLPFTFLETLLYRNS